MAAPDQPRIEPPTAPPEFRRAVTQLRAANFRAELFVEEVPAPQRIAPFAWALSADVLAAHGHVGGQRPGGRGDALWRRHLLDEEFGAKVRSPELGDRATKLRGSRRWLDAGLIGCRHGDRLGRPTGPADPTRRLTCGDRPMPAASKTNPELHESAFLKAARSEPAPHTPVWFMRQAGRSLPGVPQGARGRH